MIDTVQGAAVGDMAGEVGIPGCGRMSHVQDSIPFGGMANASTRLLGDRAERERWSRDALAAMDLPSRERSAPAWLESLTETA